MDVERNKTARDSILRDIREHLRTSLPHDAVETEKRERSLDSESEIGHPNGYARSTLSRDGLVETFRTNLEAVGGHCSVVRSEDELIAALNRIISSLQDSHLRGRRIALSNAPAMEALLTRIEAATEKIATDPSAAELFTYDVGISTAQAAIAETGTLLLDSEAERHRLVSLIPPVHIAIVDASDICLTLAEALAIAGRGSALSSTITLITGPSRTADIELTLAIGVHGPQEVFSIVRV